MGQGFAREIRRPGFGLRGHAKKEGTGPTTKASEMKIGERGQEGGAKKAGPEGSEGTREKCVGIEPCGRPTGSRNIALRKCAHTHTIHTEAIHVHELSVHVEAARTKPVHVYTVSRSRGNFRKNRARDN